MWFVAHLMASYGREISLVRATAAVILMGIFGAASHILTHPIVGAWCYLIDFIVCILVARWILQLTFWRSLAAVVVYTVVMIGVSTLLSQTLHL